MSSHSDPSGALIFLFVAGLWTLFKGFRVFREYKIVEDTPRISIRSVPMGLVHIRGAAQVDAPIPRPVSRTPCCFFKIEIDEWKAEGKSHGWSHLRTDLDGSQFFLVDESGKVLVDARAAEFDLPMNAEREVNSARSTSAGPGATDTELLQYDSYSGVHTMAASVEGWLDKKTPLEDPRREEARQTLLSMVRAVPNMMPGGGVPMELMEKMAARVRLKDSFEEQKRQELLAHFRGLAQGGMIQLPIPTPGAAGGRYRLKEYLIVPGHEYTITATCAENPGARGDGDRNLICKGAHESTFLISSKSDKGTEKDLRWRVLGMVLGGAVLSLACLAFLLIHLKLF
jgi:hypothetical protein